MAATATLAFNILAKNQASGVINKVSKDMGGLSAKAVAVGSFIGNAMTGGAKALGQMGISAIKMGITTAASLEQAQVGFTTLIGSGQKAQVFLGKLQQFAAATPFELPGLIDSSRLLLGVGVNADKVIPMLTAFGDAAGAVGVGQEAFQRIILATSQAISAGRFQVGDLNQIVTNGIPAWKLLSEATGKPVPVLRNLASSGKLLASDVLPLLQRQMEKDYGGAMAKQSQTLAGVWSTLMDTLNIGLANVLKPLVPWLEQMVPRAAAVMQTALQGAGHAVQVFVTALSGQSSPGEFTGALAQVNKAGIATRQVYNVASRTIGAFIHQMQTGTGPGGVFVKTLKGIKDTAAGMYGFLSRNHAVLFSMIAVFVTLNGLLKAYAISQAIATAGGIGKALLGIAQGWRAVQIATELATAAQWGFDAALAFFEGATGIGLVLVALGALTAAFVYLWTTNDGFRKAVVSGWHAVTAAIGSAVSWVTGTAWPALVTAWDAIAAGALSLWRGVSAAWDGITGAVEGGVRSVVAFGSAVARVLSPVGAVLLWLWRTIAVPAFQGMWVLAQIWERFTEIAFKSVEILLIVTGRGFSLLWSVASLALRGLGALATWLYKVILAPIFSAVMVLLRGVGSVFLWLWRNIAVPALQAIGAVAQAVWVHAIRPALSGFEAGVRTLGDAVSAVWRKVLAPTFGALKDFVQNKVAPAFVAGVDAIRKAWSKVEDAAKAPVRFVVDTVINQGIIGTFNKVAGYFGVGKVDPVQLPKGFYARGGVVNTPTAIVGEGGPSPEYVIPTDPKYRKRALSLYANLGTQLLASGGVVGWLTDPVGSLKHAVAPFMDRLSGIAGSPIGQLAAAAPRKLLDGVTHFLVGHAVSGLKAAGGYLTGGGGSAAVRQVGQRLAAQAGWSSAAEWASLDALWTHESGWNPAAKNPTSTAFGIPQFLKSTAAAYGLAYGSTDPVAQIKAGLQYIRDAYGDPVNAWRLWQSRSPHWYGGGGTITEPILGTGLRTGRSYGFGEHGPETVIPGRVGGQLHLHLTLNAPVGSRQQLEDWLISALDGARRKGRLNGLLT